MKIKFYNNIKYIKVIFAVLLIAYLLLLAYLTLLSKYYGREVEHRSINLIPFRTIVDFLTSGYDMRPIITNLVGNIAAFMPMGFLFPIVFKQLDRLQKIVFVALLSSLTIEVAQYILRVGASDIDDLILNVLGAIVGYWVFRLIALSLSNKKLF